MNYTVCRLAIEPTEKKEETMAQEINLDQENIKDNSFWLDEIKNGTVFKFKRVPCSWMGDGEYIKIGRIGSYKYQVFCFETSLVHTLESAYFLHSHHEVIPTKSAKLTIIY